MNVLFLMLVHAIFFAVWFVAQQALFGVGLGINGIMFISGIAALVLVGISIIRTHTMPPLRSLKWFVVTIALNSVLAEFLLRSTEKYGASFGANSIAFAPIVSLFIGYRMLNEMPRRKDIIGIAVIVIGIYFLHFRSGNTITPNAQILGVPLEWLLYASIIALSAGVAIVTIKPAIKQTDAFMGPGLMLFFAFGVYGTIKAVGFGEGFGFSELPWNSRTIFWVLMLASGFAISNWAASRAYYYSFAASVGALKRLSAPFTVLLAWLFFGATTNATMLFVGSIIIFAGALLIGIDKEYLHKLKRSIVG